MSLLRPVIRTTAVAALRDQTWAQERVYDSDNTPLGTALLGTEAKPYIVVYTDVDDRTPEAAMIYTGTTRSLSVTLEIGVASAIVGTNGETIIRFAATDEGMEWAVDIVETQALAALIGNPKSPWGDLFKQMAFRITRIPSRRGGKGEQGVRYAARQTTLVCSTLDDPPPGVVPSADHPIRKFIALARAAPEALGVVDVASLVEGVLTQTAASDWEQAQAYLGMSKQAVNQMGIAPYWAPIGYDEEVAPDLTSIEIVPEAPVHYTPLDADNLIGGHPQPGKPDLPQP